MKNTVKLLMTISVILSLTCCNAPSKRWSEEKANRWYAQQGWLSGCNYTTSTAINQIEMWSADTFDPETIDRELGWGEDLGFNTMRVFLSSLVWENDPEGLKDRMEVFLQICTDHGIRPFFVFFDDCWDPVSHYGKQREPRPGIHNSGWVQDPSVERRRDTLSLYPVLEAYMKDIIGTFRKDKRILMWDVYNEPGNSRHLNASIPLLKKSFEWARAARPTQPLTAAVTCQDFGDLNKIQLENSDIVCLHTYSAPELVKHAIDTLKTYGRPVMCTEYMARPFGCSFQSVMPLLKENNVAAVNWGFVAGKTNTIYPWGGAESYQEPDVWFHDIIRVDGTPFSEEEVKLIRQINGKCD